MKVSRLQGPWYDKSLQNLLYSEVRGPVEPVGVIWYEAPDERSEAGRKWVPDAGNSYYGRSLSDLSYLGGQGLR